VKLAAAALALALLASSAAAEPVQLKFADPIPPQGFLHTQAFVPWTDEVNKAGEGVIEVKLFPGPAIANLGNIFDRVLNGVADIGWGNFAPVTTQFPKSNVATLPFETRSGAEASMGFWRLYEKGVISEEYERVRVLALTTFPGAHLRAKKNIQTLADMRGMKIAAEGRVVNQSLEALGATPVHQGLMDFYQSLQRGTLDAVVVAWPAILPFKLNEVVTHHIEAPMGNDSGYVIMNKESYARLPAKGREIIDRFSGTAFSERLMRVIDAAIVTSRNAIQSMPGQSVTKLAPDEEARWAARVAPVIEDWTRSTPDGGRVLAAFRDEVKKIREGASR
jgi:TRAP-type C4-dicarboxylate transport system substrate-binding protein